LLSKTETSSQIEESPVKDNNPKPIDPTVWSKARVELANLLKTFGTRKY